MTDQNLLKNLSRLGVPLFEVDDSLDVNETLAEVVKSSDPRLWESFPVVLANTAEGYLFSAEKVEQLLPDRETRSRFHYLLLLASALYSLYDVSLPWNMRFQHGFSPEEKGLLKNLKTCLNQNETLQWKGLELDPQRLKRVFELYFEQKVAKERRNQEKNREFSLEYALSQIFSPKQKELFQKRLKGLPFTKTEQEYYSRTVRKKVIALANSDLHNLAKKLLEH